MKIRSPNAPSAPLFTRLFETALLTVVFMAVMPAARGAALTPDGVALTIGDGNNVTIYGVATHWDSLCTCSALKDLGFDTRLVAQLAYWHGREHPAVRNSMWDASVTPMLRWIAPQMAGVRGFAELGVGVRALSATRINTERNFGSAFQFGETGGVGIAFGERQRYEVGVYAQHISNAGIKEPNNGITYFGVVLRTSLPQ